MRANHMDKITNERKMDDDLREQQIIHILESVINHNWSTRGLNMKFVDDIMPLWKQDCDEVW